MKRQVVELTEDVSHSPLYNEDLAPTPLDKRTWRVWNLAAIWVGMAVCIPTWLLASYMIKAGLPWQEALIIIGVANLVVCLPMILNGHAGVKYGVPFPVLGRAAFGVGGIHIPAIVRGLVACGWFGIQTWIGGLALYAIWCAVWGQTMSADLTAGKFVGFGLFWLLNIFFIWRGTESIRWLEDFSAPILVLIGLALIAWGTARVNGFGVVLDQSEQLTGLDAVITPERNGLILTLQPLRNLDGSFKAQSYQISWPDTAGAPQQSQWLAMSRSSLNLTNLTGITEPAATGEVQIRFRRPAPGSDSGYAVSSPVTPTQPGSEGPDWMFRLYWLTAMVGFWATMSISIADITRYAKSQTDQVRGQLIGLPPTMVLYSFVGVFVTCASLIVFDDILIGADAPWDPVTLLAKFDNPLVVIVAQFFMLIATLSTNIAANVIAPANAFANAFPRQVSFRMGGVITGVIGILICPWWLLNDISGLLLFVSGLLGPVLGVLIADYYFVRKTDLQLAELYKTDGAYAYVGGVNPVALFALTLGVIVALVGYFMPALKVLYDLSWFTGFAMAFVVYLLGMKVVFNPQKH